MADKKLFRVIKALLVSVCILLCSATAVACKSCKKNDTDVESGEFPSITFTSAAEAYVGEYYKLEMRNGGNYNGEKFVERLRRTG